MILRRGGEREGRFWFDIALRYSRFVGSLVWVEYEGRRFGCTHRLNGTEVMWREDLRETGLYLLLDDNELWCDEMKRIKIELFICSTQRVYVTRLQQQRYIKGNARFKDGHPLFQKMRKRFEDKREASIDYSVTTHD